jgi:hypothetical protein
MNAAIRQIYQKMNNANLTRLKEAYRIVPLREAFHSTARGACGKVRAMAELDETERLSWPWWAPWALLAVVLTSILTIGATLYDIL